MRAFPRNARRKAQAGEANFAAIGIHQDVGGLDVPMHQLLLVEPAQRRRERDGNVQEGSNFHRAAQHPLERLETSVAQRHRTGRLAAAHVADDRDMELTQHALSRSGFMARLKGTMWGKR